MNIIYCTWVWVDGAKKHIFEWMRAWWKKEERKMQKSIKDESIDWSVMTSIWLTGGTAFYLCDILLHHYCIMHALICELCIDRHK